MSNTGHIPAWQYSWHVPLASSTALGHDLEAARKSRERQATLEGVALVDGDKHGDDAKGARRGRPRQVNGNHKTVTEQILLARAQERAAKAAALAPPALSFEEQAL